MVDFRLEEILGNVRFHCLIFKSFPQELLGNYDVVHLRFFCTIVNNEDAHPLLESLIVLLSMCNCYGLLASERSQPLPSCVCKSSKDYQSCDLKQSRP